MQHAKACPIQALPSLFVRSRKRMHRTGLHSSSDSSHKGKDVGLSPEPWAQMQGTNTAMDRCRAQTQGSVLSPGPRRSHGHGDAGPSPLMLVQACGLCGRQGATPQERLAAFVASSGPPHREGMRPLWPPGGHPAGKACGLRGRQGATLQERTALLETQDGSLAQVLACAAMVCLLGRPCWRLHSPSPPSQFGRPHMPPAPPPGLCCCPAPPAPRHAPAPRAAAGSAPVRARGGTGPL